MELPREFESISIAASQAMTRRPPSQPARHPESTQRHPEHFHIGFPSSLGPRLGLKKYHHSSSLIGVSLKYPRQFQSFARDKIFAF